MEIPQDHSKKISSGTTGVKTRIINSINPLNDFTSEEFITQLKATFTNIQLKNEGDVEYREEKLNQQVHNISNNEELSTDMILMLRNVEPSR